MTLTVDISDDGSKFVLTTDEPMHTVKDRLGSLNGIRWGTNITLPKTWPAYVELSDTFPKADYTEAVQTWEKTIVSDVIEPALALRSEYSTNDSDVNPKLYPFQKVGVKFLSTVRKALLCDEMGTGKTVQTIETLKHLYSKGNNVFPVIIVCPLSVTMSWKKEFSRWWPDVLVTVVAGTRAEKMKALTTPSHVYIINFESLRMFSRLTGYGSIRLKRCSVCDPNNLGKPSSCERCPKILNSLSWTTLVVDEAHRIKDPKAKQTRACWALATDKTENIFCLSGTPIAKHPADLFGILRLIDPESFTSKQKYIERYCDFQEGFFGGITIRGLLEENKETFFRMFNPIMRRMSKKVVLEQLPEKVYSVRPIKLTREQRKQYNAMTNSMMVDGILAPNPLAKALRLSQFASATCHAELSDEEGTVVSMKEPSNKITALLELIADNPDEPLVIFAESRKLIDLVSQRLTKHELEHTLIVGGQNPEERQQAVDDFQNGKVNYVLCTIKAGGTGITLTRSRKVVFLQRSWSMIDNVQAEDRVHRIGSEVHEFIEVIDFQSIGTIDEKQRDIMETKKKSLEELMRDKELYEKVK